MQRNKQNQTSMPANPQSGNAFLMVLIGVVLMAGLMFTFTRSARQGGTDMSDRQASIAVTDIMAFAQRSQRAIDRIMRKGSTSEVDLEFADSALEDYDNPACTGSRCQVFNVGGGGLTYPEPEERWFDSAYQDRNSYGNWVFTAANRVTGIGNDCADASCAEILAVLPFIKENLCLKLNEELGIDNPGDFPPKSAGDIALAKFFGTFAASETIGKSNGDPFGPTACVQVDSGTYAGAYMFYHVIKAR